MHLSEHVIALSAYLNAATGTNFVASNRPDTRKCSTKCLPRERE